MSRSNFIGRNANYRLRNIAYLSDIHENIFCLIIDGQLNSIFYENLNFEINTIGFNFS